MDDAEKLNEYLVDVKVDNLHLNFSDPWPKKKHHKRRLTYPTMLNQYKNYLKDGNIDHVYCCPLPTLGLHYVR